jgi:UDP-2,3-diacylglucosamine pyrophosphatase LpxH
VDAFFARGSKPFLRKGNHDSFVPNTKTTNISIGIYSSMIHLKYSLRAASSLVGTIAGSS